MEAGGVSALERFRRAPVLAVMRGGGGTCGIQAQMFRISGALSCKGVRCSHGVAKGV